MKLKVKTFILPAAVAARMGIFQLAIWLSAMAAFPIDISAQTCATKPTGLVAWWPADGFALDVAGTNNGTLLGGIAYGSGAAGQAFSFNGSSSYVQVPDSPFWAFGANDFTIELWANFANASGSPVLVGQDEGPGSVNKWLFWLDNGKLEFHINGPGNVLIGSISFNPTLGQWYHLAVTRQANFYRFYVNGSVVGTASNSLQVPDANAPLRIGWAEESYFFNGRLDEVSIYNTALSTAQIASIYAAGSSGKCFTNDSAPVFIQQPVGFNGHIGQSSTLSGVAMGSPRPTYQWLLNNVAIPGATSSSLFLTNLSLANSGTYVLVASNMFGVCQSQPVEVSVDPRELSGPTSRKTGIVISEIMYKPAARTDTNNLEFIEIYNSNPWFHDVGNYRVIADNMSYSFPAGTTIPANGFLVVAASPGSLRNVYNLTNNILGPYTGSLKKSGTIELHDEQGAVLLAIPYANVAPWPVAADGTGHSLVLTSPTYGEANPQAWGISESIGGSPGRSDALASSPLRNVVINEFLAHTDSPEVDYIELYNHANQPVDISGCILTDDVATNKFIVPTNSIIPAHGFVYYTQTNMGFALDAAGETIYFKNPTQTRVLDAVRFDGQENGTPTGRWPDGADQFYRLSSKTPGTNNAAIRTNNIVINELMYHPISGNDDDQYVELFNRSGGPVNLAGWQLEDGINYKFLSGTILPANGYLVVAKNAAHLMTNYPNLNAANTLGDFSGKLSHKGDRVVLTMPDTTVSTNNGVVQTNTIHIVMNEVAFGTGGRWGQWSDGDGSSLELMDSHSDNRLAANWADSDDTSKSTWTNIEVTGVLDNGDNYGSGISYAQIGLLDAGECLVDNLEVLAGTSGVNYVSNPDFEGSLANWSLQGCFVRSSLENSGYASGHSLHIRCSDRLWTGVNSCQVALNPNSLVSGQTGTLRFKARWLHGWPEILFRLNGNWLEATGALPIPKNLGTPGAVNSRSSANNGPAIYNVTHSPAVPAANEAVVVTASVYDPDGLQSMTLNYRIDPSATYTAVTMKDDGTGGDAIAHDGIFSATIPGQSSGVIAAFYLSAMDNLSATTRFPALVNDGAPVRECVVMFGDGNPGGSFGVYHLWLTQANVTRWSNLPNLSNESMDGTFVNGNRVIYNMQGRFAGSPFHQVFDAPNGSLCHYSWTFPKDDMFLGATAFNKIHQPGNGPGEDASLQREQLANLCLRSLGVPWLYKRLVAVYVNGNRRGTLMEDTQVPNNDFVEEYFPDDSNGYLYKMQPWYEFAPFPAGTFIQQSCPLSPCHSSWCNLMPYTTTGGAKKTARYRYMFLVRGTPDSASNFKNVFSLVDAANSYGTANYVPAMENIANMEEWMRMFAADHAAGNQDCFGAETAQNIYGYIGTGGTRYTLMLWDFNQVFGHSNWGPGANLFYSNPEDPNTANIYNNPTFRRMYWRALQELMNGPFDVAVSGPMLDAKYNAFVADGLSVESPDAIKSWMTSARSSITSQLAAENATSFTMSAPVISNNVAYLAGTAPVNAKTIWFNGIEYPITWLSVTGWRVIVPLLNSTNRFSVVGVDVRGQPIANYTNNISIVFSGTNSSPVDRIAINEIMYAPAAPDAEYVELYNTSSNTTFDLSGWEFKGLSYTFPAGSLLSPNRFLVLAANRAAFAATYGATIPVFDTFSGTLQGNGETLSLIKPGTNAANDLVIAKVRYESSLPWPTNAAGTGRSLQLIDPGQDNFREGNWTAIQTNLPPSLPQWVYVTATGTASSSLLYVYLQSAGDVYIDDLKLVAGSIPEAGVNVISNGDFESAFPGSAWSVSPNLSASASSSTVKHSGNASLHVISSSAGSSQGTAIYQTISPALVNNATYTLSFWYLQNTNGGPLTLRLSGSGITSTINPAPVTVAGINQIATPGATNGDSVLLPPFPSLWINELQAENLTGITNRNGQRTPWLELYNPSTNMLSLTNLFLANDYSNLASWAFPAGATINPGEFKIIFADGQTNLSTLAEWHAGFTLSTGSGSLVLSRFYNGQPQVIDYVNYANINPDRSYGSMPDGQGFDRQEFFFVTPGGPNNGTAAPLMVKVNEWMADNTHTLTNSIGGKYDDWFELYNYGTNVANLAGYYLTDTLTNKLQFQIPAGYSIAPHGFLLVWADGKTPTGSGALHVNFKLDKAGESIGLFGVDGTAVDFINFNSQTSDVSQGRYLDGGPLIYSLPLATPGASNIFFNSPPTLSAISNRVVVLGQNLFITANATDIDVPPQTLSFSLGNGTPAGATIQANTGVLNWTPSQAPATNTLTVTVSDNGIPMMTSTQTFLVTTVFPPQLQASPAVNDGRLILSFPTWPGLSYQLEYKDDLNTAAWNPIGMPILGAQGSVNLTNNLTGASRFFRLRVLP